MELPYPIVWPISVFSLGGLTGIVDPPPGGGNAVQLVREEMNHDVPVLHTRADGRLRFVGWDNLTIGKRNINAKKCEFPRREERMFGIGKD